MTIHVNIGEAKTKFSSLIAAALRGEVVIVNKAGRPVIRLVPEQMALDLEREATRAKRAAWMGSGIDRMPSGTGDLFLQPTYTDEEWAQIENSPLVPDDFAAGYPCPDLAIQRTAPGASANKGADCLS